jgi:DNA-binding transcriptional LysR family regulator
MELRQLEAFVAVATALHFGRAAEQLHIAQPTLSELVRRLEREVGTPLLTRTTRRVTLTSAGFELLGRAKVILDDVAAATAAVRRIAAGDAGTVRVGIVPPVAPVLAPHLVEALLQRAPEVELVVRRMWAPDLARAVAEGTVDVAITCGLVPDRPAWRGRSSAESPSWWSCARVIGLPVKTGCASPTWPGTGWASRASTCFPPGRWRNARPSTTRP